jgi:hypothetical protein
VAIVIEAPTSRRADLAGQITPRIMDLLRTGGGAAVVVDGPVASWTDETAALAGSLGDEPQPSPLAERVTTALNLLAERPGRKVLLIHTEGGPAVDRSGWKDLVQKAEGSGAQIVVSALWTGELIERDRRQLRKIANASGGRMELVEAPSLLTKVFDALAGRLEATAVVRIRGAAEGRVQVESIPPATVEAHPERLR